MEKYIVKCDIKELYLKKGEILIIKNNTPCLAKNEERKFPYIDLHNTKFFEPFTEKFKRGDYVKYENIVYEVVGFDNGQKGMTFVLLIVIDLLSKVLLKNG